jgi:sulfate adenylyltransferase subunit 2
MHVDTGHNFPEVIEFRDRLVAELGERLIVASVQDSIDSGRVVEETGPRASRNRLQTVTLLDAIAEHGFDAAFGGAAATRSAPGPKERIFSFRDDFGQWDPKNQRPSCGTCTTADPQGRARPGVPDLQLDRARRLAVHRRGGPGGAVDLLRARARGVRARRDALRDLSPFVELLDGEEPFSEWVRYRTVGDMSCTGAVESRRDARGGREGDRRDAHHRARRDARRRPGERGGDGGSQAEGYF